jgi:hypothetical protein
MLDNEKAFDRVQWPFMLRCLRAFGLPETFIQGVSTMYTDISTAVKTNGRLGNPFGVSSGIRQGCVLSARCPCVVAEDAHLLRVLTARPDAMPAEACAWLH